jgi:thioredoxin-related protein
MSALRRFAGSVFVFLCLAGVSFQASAQPSARVPEAGDLVSDSGRSRDLGAPIVLVVTREECGYCSLLKSTVIVPMILSGEYEGRALIRELNIDATDEVTDFGGRRVSPFAVADRHDALLTPTVLILGPGGEEVAPRLVGINNEQMYLWYLDRAIEVGAAAIAASGALTP